MLVRMYLMFCFEVLFMSVIVGVQSNTNLNGFIVVNLNK